MPDLLEPLQYAFVQRALLAAVLVALVCASVGVFVVLRGLAFLGDAIAHAAFPGVVIAFLVKINIVIGGSIAAVASALAIGAVARRSGLKEDTAIGVVFSGMFAIGIVLFSSIRTYTGDLLGILFGDVLGVSADQLMVAAITAAVVLVALWIIWRQLVFVSFDPIGAVRHAAPRAHRSRHRGVRPDRRRRSRRGDARDAGRDGAASRTGPPCPGRRRVARGRAVIRRGHLAQLLHQCRLRWHHRARCHDAVRPGLDRAHDRAEPCGGRLARSRSRSS